MRYFWNLVLMVLRDAAHIHVATRNVKLTFLVGGWVKSLPYWRFSVAILNIFISLNRGENHPNSSILLHHIQVYRLSHILTFDYKGSGYWSYVGFYMDYFIYLRYLLPNNLLNRNQSKDYMTTGVWDGDVYPWHMSSWYRKYKSIYERK